MMAMDLKQHALALAAAEWGGQVDDGRLVPLSSALDALVGDEGPSCSVIGNWYLAQADARQEKTATKAIADVGFPAYRPVVETTQIERGRKVTTEKSMFGMYFFVKCEPSAENWHKIRMARGVRRLLTYGGQWLCVPEAAMDVVRLKEAEFMSPLARNRFVWHFSPGDIVRIKSGPFAYFSAKLESAVDEQGRLTALVEIFGRHSRIHLEATQVEAI